MEKKEITRTCTGCEAKGTGRNGTVADNTPPDWSAFLSHDQGFLFLCQDCSSKVKRHAVEILAVVKTKQSLFNSLPGIRKTHPVEPPPGEHEE